LSTDPNPRCTSLGAKSLFKKTVTDPAAFTGGEILAGDIVEIEFGGTQFQLVGNIVDPVTLVPTGAVMPFAGSTAPTGWLLCAGQAVSRTTYAALFAVLGTTFGAGDGSTTFALPGMRGRAVFGVDNMGGGAANRLGAGSAGGVTGTASLGATGGEQKHTLTIAECPHIPIRTTTGTQPAQVGSAVAATLTQSTRVLRAAAARITSRLRRWSRTTSARPEQPHYDHVLPFPSNEDMGT
jgi:microcystin-dependent protein